MSFFVYIHTCPNGKKYVGVTKRTTEERWQNGEGYKGQKHFYAAIQKYGWDNIEHESFEVESSSLMLYWERVLIYHFKTIDRKYGYNKSGGGECINGFYLSDEIKRKISNTKKGSIPWNKGKQLSDKNKQKISESLKGNQRALGHTLSDESKKKMVEKLRGKKTVRRNKAKKS